MSDVAVTFGAKDENLAKTFKSVGEQTKSLGEQFKTLLIPLAAIGGAFLAIKKMSADFQKAIDMGGRLHELSRQTDESAGNLMVLQRAFQNAGAGAESVGTTLARMNRFIAEAGEGGKAQTEIMGKLGLTMADLADKTPTEQLKLLAERVAGLQSPADRTNVAMQLFGRSGAELVPLFRAMGVELENARNQLGSAPAVADKAAQMFNTLGNNLNAVREKSAEFAFGLLSELLPNLVAVSDRLANIDAAGVGAKLSEYAKKTLDWATQTFKLGDALKNAETAFKAITSGDIGGGLKLMFLQARDTAINAVNQISAAAMAAIQTVSGVLQELLNPSGAVVHMVNTLLGVAMNTIKQGMYSVLSEFMTSIGRMGMADTFKMQAETAASAVKIALGGIGAQVELVGDQVKKVISDAPKDFKANYESNIKDPLIEMESRMAETASHAAKVQENLEGAANEAAKINKFGELQNFPPMPAQARSHDLVDGPKPAPTPSGGTATVATPRQLTARERALSAPFEAQASSLEAQGRFSAADRARQQGERKVEQQRQRDANRQLQKDLGLGSGATRSPEQIAREEGKVSPLDKDAFRERVQEIKDEIKARAGQGDGTEDTSGKGGKDDKDKPTQSPLEKLVSEIKSLVEKIEPKLPVAALTA